MQQVLCALSHEGSDVRCAVCGQGFLVYWSRYSREEQAETRRVIQEQLRVHHVRAKDPGADRRKHPRHPFTVPAWTGHPEFAATLLNNQIAEDEMAMEEVA